MLMGKYGQALAKSKWMLEKIHKKMCQWKGGFVKLNKPNISQR